MTASPPQKRFKSLAYKQSSALACIATAMLALLSKWHYIQETPKGTDDL
jgi:hypothetical protein